MADHPKLKEAQARIMEMGYPPDVIALPPARALGHRLAKAVAAKGNLPARPFALVDGLAVLARDSVLAQSESGGASLRACHDSQAGTLAPPEQQESAAEEEPPAQEEPSTEEEAAPEASPQDDPGTVLLDLRADPHSNKKEDALLSGQAIAVPVGGEVPRGAEHIHPFSEIVAGLQADLPDLSPPEKPAQGDEKRNEAEEKEELPKAGPPREWDLVGQHTSGTIELERSAERPADNMVGSGGWARNHEELLPEQTLLRPGEVALLDALGIESVEVYRRPVAGIASLGLPLPQEQKTTAGNNRAGVCPLATLAALITRSARVTALPLGFAPTSFRDLASAVERWLDQVDILLLVGGSHHGPRGLGNDLIASLGKPALTGLDPTPG
ncbi:hypothetical protein IIA79_08445, partial [bacterium]|nr:hypothetical protein [bacterium]